MFASMAQSVMRLIGRIAGVSSPPEHTLYYVRNESATFKEEIRTVHLVPVVNEEEQRIEFVLPPDYKGNLLGFLMSSFHADDGERIIITEVARLHYTNELDNKLRFVVECIFDPEEKIDAIRSVVDKAVSPPSSETTLTGTGGAVRRIPVSSSSSSSTQHRPKEKEEVASDTEDPFVARLMTANNASTKREKEPFFSKDDVTVRGQHACRNQTERKNELSLDVLEANRTAWSEDARVLYRSSVSNQIITWFAGHDGEIMSVPTQITTSDNNRPGLSPEERANEPVISLAIYPSGHSLVMFILMFRDDLNVGSGEMSQYKGNDSNSTTFWAIDIRLIDRARQMILYVIYAQMYYTTMHSARLVRRVASEVEDNTILRATAIRWNLPFDQETKRFKGASLCFFSTRILVSFRLASRRV